MMDFRLDETQSALRDLVRRIFTERATHERLKELEAGSQWFDAELWQTLRDAGLLWMGEGTFLEQCVVLIEQGRTVAPVPLWSHLPGAVAASEHADGLLALALDEPWADDAFALGTRAEREGDGYLVTGEKVGVPALDVASHVVVTADGPEGPGVFVVEAAGLDHEHRLTTAGFPEFAVSFDRVPARRVSSDATTLANMAVIALCALGVGIAERALEITARYTSERKQFGRPLGSFQAVQQRAADAYVDVEAMRCTMWQAAWRISEGLEAAHAVRVAKFWAAQGGQRVVSAAQHLHGGMGADIDYPLFRYTLWSKWVELSFGAATPQLARMGAELAR